MEDNKAEEAQIRKEDLHKLQDNRVFKEMLTQLQTRLNSRHKEQRQALQECNKDRGLLLEGVLVGLEEALKVYNAQFIDKTEKPTVSY